MQYETNAKPVDVMLPDGECLRFLTKAHFNKRQKEIRKDAVCGKPLEGKDLAVAIHAFRLLDDADRFLCDLNAFFGNGKFRRRNHLPDDPRKAAPPVRCLPN